MALTATGLEKGVLDTRIVVAGPHSLSSPSNVLDRIEYRKTPAAFFFKYGYIPKGETMPPAPGPVEKPECEILITQEYIRRNTAPAIGRWYNETFETDRTIVIEPFGTQYWPRDMRILSGIIDRAWIRKVIINGHGDKGGVGGPFTLNNVTNVNSPERKFLELLATGLTYDAEIRWRTCDTGAGKNGEQLLNAKRGTGTVSLASKKPLS